MHRSNSNGERSKLIPGVCTIRYVQKFNRYEVDSGLKLGGAKRHRKQFKRKSDAINYARELKERLDEQGLSGFTLSREDQIDAECAFEILNGQGSLLEACKFFMRFHGTHNSDLLIKDLVDEFMHERDRMSILDSKGSSDRTYKDYNHRLGKLSKEFGRLPVISFKEDEFLSWLRIRGDIRGMMRTTKALFSFAVEKKYLPENPIRSKIPKVKIGKPSILEDHQWRSLALTALNTQDHKNSPRGQPIDLLACVVLGLWCGLRPEAELRRLDWEDVNIEDGFVNIHDDWKVAVGRHVTIPNCAKELLRQCINKSGPVVNPRNFRKRWEWLRKSAGVFDAWDSDIMRHTYASMHYALNNNKRLTVNELGHCNSSMLRHYINHGAKMRERSKEFFSFDAPFQKKLDACDSSNLIA